MPCHGHLPPRSLGADPKTRKSLTPTLSPHSVFKGRGRKSGLSPSGMSGRALPGADLRLPTPFFQLRVEFHGAREPFEALAVEHGHVDVRAWWRCAAAARTAAEVQPVEQCFFWRGAW